MSGGIKIIKLFGFTLGREGVVEQQKATQPAFSLPNSAMDDGAVNITSNAHYGTYVDLEGSVRNELELITRYREMSNHPELEMAIDEIVNEAITRDEFGKIVDINLDKLKQSDAIKKKIIEEFEAIQKMINFKTLADDLFKRWYIDGRLFYHVIVDEAKPKEDSSEEKPKTAPSTWAVKNKVRNDSWRYNYLSFFNSSMY